MCSCSSGFFSRKGGIGNLVQETNRHLLLHLRTLECTAKIVERNLAHTDRICLDDCSLGDAVQLILADVSANHHLQNVEQLLARNRLVVIEIVHAERESQLGLAAIQLVFLVRFDRPEVGQDTRELSKVYAIVAAVGEEGVHYSLAQWIDRELRDAQEIFARQRSTVVPIE